MKGRTLDFRVVVAAPQDLAAMAVEIRLALGLEPRESYVALYRRFAMADLTDELDMRLIEFCKDYGPMALNEAGHMRWDEATGLISYPVNVPPEFLVLRQKLAEVLPPEVQITEQYEPHITIGYIAALGRNQRDLVERLFFPAKWSINRIQLESESAPGKWLLEAGYSLDKS